MSNDRSVVDVETGVDHCPTSSKHHDPPGNGEDGSNPLENNDGAHTRSPNHEETCSENNEIDAPPMSKSNGLQVDNEKVPLPVKRKACFFLTYTSFVILYLVFFLVIAFGYPLKPECHLDNFYLPVFDKVPPNSTEEMKGSIYLQLRFKNRNKLIPVSYNDFLNITMYYYLPNSTKIIFFANCTLPGFHQHKTKPRSVAVLTPAPGLPGLLQLQEAFSTMVFRVDLEFSLRFHCREVGRHKHRFLMTADVEVSLETGTWFEDTIQMSEVS